MHALIMGLCFGLSAYAEAPSEPNKKKVFVDKLLARMTLEEKTGQLSQLSVNWQKTGPGGTPDFVEKIEKGQAGTILNSYSLDSMRRLQKSAVEKTRLKIPLLFAGDILTG